MEEEPPKPVLFLVLLLLSYVPLPISSIIPPQPLAPTPSPSPTKPSLSPPKPITTPPLSPTPSPSPRKPSVSPHAHSTLDPKQLTALQSLNIPTARDPCLQPSPNNATRCDSSSPFRHLISLHLSNCSGDVEMSSTALKSLNTLQDLSFFDCPINPIHLPADLADNLRTFTCIASLRHLTGVWLSRLRNVTDLAVSDVPVNASGPTIILSSLRKLRTVTVARANLTGDLPKRWHPNISYVDLSGNRLKGHLPISLTRLEDLQVLNLSSNQLAGPIPETFGDLISLKTLSLSSNSMAGPIPDSLASMPALEHLDLSSNQFNGTVPNFLSEMKRLKYLNLENNNFQGVIPFNGSFINKLEFFKVGRNSNLCYNHTILSSKLKLGIAPCDRDGLPVSPPPDRHSSADSSADDGDSSDGSDTADEKPKKDHHHGPNKFFCPSGARDEEFWLLLSRSWWKLEVGFTLFGLEIRRIESLKDANSRDGMSRDDLAFAASFEFPPSILLFSSQVTGIGGPHEIPHVSSKPLIKEIESIILLYGQGVALAQLRHGADRSPKLPHWGNVKRDGPSPNRIQGVQVRLASMITVLDLMHTKRGKRTAGKANHLIPWEKQEER
ncbi:hypothetical protein ACLOJK_010603 [Asimina triloba]